MFSDVTHIDRKLTQTKIYTDADGAGEKTVMHNALKLKTVCGHFRDTEQLLLSMFQSGMALYGNRNCIQICIETVVVWASQCGPID